MSENLLLCEIYNKEHNHLTQSLFTATIQRINAEYYNLLEFRNIYNFLKFFFIEKKEKEFDDYLKSFIETNFYQNSLIITFYEDKSGWKEVVFNREAKKFQYNENAIDKDVFDLYFCRESFLKSLCLPALFNLNELDSVALKILFGIRRDFIYIIDDILKLKYYLDYGVEFIEENNENFHDDTLVAISKITLNYEEVDKKLFFKICYKDGSIKNFESRITQYDEIISYAFQVIGEKVILTSTQHVYFNKKLKDNIKTESKKQNLRIPFDKFFTISPQTSKGHYLKLQTIEISLS